MKVAGLDLPEAARRWLPEQPFDAREHLRTHIWDKEGRHAGFFFSAAPELADALVDVTQALVDGLEVHAPGVDPLQHVAVQKALAALAKARGEA